MDLDKQDMIDLVEGMSEPGELRNFAKEVLGHTFPSASGADSMKKGILEILDHQSSDASGDEIKEKNGLPPDSRQSDPPEKQRMLRNKRNGRTFIWSKKLSKLKHMEEV